MDKNDLKFMWREIHAENQDDNKETIEKTTKMKHSKIISKVLSDQKLKILLYSIFFAIYTGLMIYALLYLNLHLSVNSIIPLFLVGLFVLIKTTSEINRFMVLTRTADNMSIKDSMLFFRKKLNKIRTIDFLSYLIFFFLLAIGTTFIYLKDIGGIKNLSHRNEMLPILIVLILMLLFIPWLIKYQHNHRYKKLYSNLKDSVKFLNNES
jgi:hypothetical protein